MPGQQLCSLEPVVKTAKIKEVLLLLELTKNADKKLQGKKKRRKKKGFLSRSPTLAGTA